MALDKNVVDCHQTLKKMRRLNTNVIKGHNIFCGINKLILEKLLTEGAREKLNQTQQGTIWPIVPTRTYKKSYRIILTSLHFHHGPATFSFQSISNFLL